MPVPPTLSLRSERPARCVVVSGASGLVGRRLLGALRAEGVAVRALSRRPAHASSGSGGDVEWIAWDGLDPPLEALEGADAVVHLAGEPIFGGRLRGAQRRRVWESRVTSTCHLVRRLGAIERARRPQQLLCASAVGYYGSRGEEILDEESPAGSGYLARLCAAWEEAAGAAREVGVRPVSLRLGIVLAREGGALPRLARLFRLGLGGRLGSGRQWVPWIHAGDAVELVRFALAHPTLTGPLNAVAPQPVRNAELTRTLAQCVRRPAWLPAPALGVRLLLGELADELLGSRRVIPRRAGEAGFRFEMPTLGDALARELAAGA